MDTHRLGTFVLAACLAVCTIGCSGDPPPPDPRFTPEEFAQMEASIPASALEMEDLLPISKTPLKLEQGEWMSCEGMYEGKLVLSMVQVRETETGYETDGVPATDDLDLRKGFYLYDTADSSLKEITGLEEMLRSEYILNNYGFDRAVGNYDRTYSYGKQQLCRRAVMNGRYYYQWFFEGSRKQNEALAHQPEKTETRKAYLIQIDLATAQGKIVEEWEYRPEQQKIAVDLFKWNEQELLMVKKVNEGSFLLQTIHGETGTIKTLRELHTNKSNLNDLSTPYISDYFMSWDGALYNLGYKRTADTGAEIFLYQIDPSSGSLTEAARVPDITSFIFDFHGPCLKAADLLVINGGAYRLKDGQASSLLSPEEQRILRQLNEVAYSNFYYDFSGSLTLHSSEKAKYLYFTKPDGYQPQQGGSFVPALYAWNLQTMEQVQLELPQELGGYALQFCLDEKGNMVLEYYGKSELYYIPKETLDALAASAEAAGPAESSAQSQDASAL